MPLGLLQAVKLGTNTAGNGRDKILVAEWLKNFKEDTDICVVS